MQDALLVYRIECLKTGRGINIQDKLFVYRMGC